MISNFSSLFQLLIGHRADIEGATISNRVDRLSDLRKPERESNKDHAYHLTFKKEKGELVFLSIEEEK